MIHNKGEDSTLSANFHLREFDCNCTSPECTVTLVHVDLVLSLEKLRKAINLTIKISSGFRCVPYNKVVGGVSKSQHCLGGAADVVYPDPSMRDFIVAEARKIFKFVHSYDSFVHCDIRLPVAKN